MFNAFSLGLPERCGLGREFQGEGHAEECRLRNMLFHKDIFSHLEWLS